MKTYTNDNPSVAFRPVTISFTIESEVELALMWAKMVKTAFDTKSRTTNRLILKALGDPMDTDASNASHVMWKVVDNVARERGIVSDE